MTGHRTNSGAQLQKDWQIPAKQVRYHKDGVWFMPLDRFPSALCDPNGYVLFASPKDYASSRHLSLGHRVNGGSCLTRS